MLSHISENISYECYRFPKPIESKQSDNAITRFAKEIFNSGQAPSKPYHLAKEYLPRFVSKAMLHHSAICYNPVDYFFSKKDMQKVRFDRDKRILVEDNTKGTPRKPQSIKRRVLDAVFLGPLLGLSETISSALIAVVSLVKAVAWASFGSLLAVLTNRNPKTTSLLFAKNNLIEMVSSLRFTIQSAPRIVPVIGHFLGCGAAFIASLIDHAIFSAMYSEPTPKE